MAYTDVINRVSQNQQNNLDLILTKLRQGDGGSPYTAPPKEDPDRKYVPAPKQKLASTPQDGRAPTRLFYNAPYDKPKMFIKDEQTIKDAKERFKLNTGIDLANTRGYQVTGNGNFVDPAGRVFQNIDGKLIYEGNYDEAIHGELIPPTEQANQSMQINPLMAQFPYEFDGGVVTPRYFTPPRYRNQPFLHIRTKDITDEELFHFNNFIRSMGGGLDTVRRQTPLSIG